jgi:hypothetical protein
VGSSAGSMDECSFLRNRSATSEWGTKHVVQAVKRGPGNRRGETDVALSDFLKHDQSGTTLRKVIVSHTEEASSIGTGTTGN